MYAIVRDGSHQLRVEQGQTVRLAYRGELEPGAEVKLDEVLLLAEGAEVQIGSPTVAGASVTTKVTAQGKDKKITVYKYKRRKNYSRKQGHRQKFTEVVVGGIEAPAA